MPHRFEPNLWACSTSTRSRRRSRYSGHHAQTWRAEVRFKPITRTSAAAQVRERVRDVLLGDRDVEVTARDQRAVEALRVEPRGGLDREALGAARPEPVDKRHDPQLSVVAGGRGHAANIMPEPPAADDSAGEHRMASPTHVPATAYGGRHQHLMTSPQSRTDALPSAEGDLSDGLPERSYPGFFSSAKSFALPAGNRFGPEGVRGYYIDLRVKAEEAVWPHASLGRLEDRLWVRVHQWGLGAYERYLAGEGEQWLRNAMEVGRYALSQQVARRPARRPVAEPPALHEDLPAAGRVAVGDGAGRGREPAGAAVPRDRRRALGRRRAARGAPRCALPSAEGGVQAPLDGRAWPEEYPTDPPSYVLNGGIFALWGLYDVGAALGDDEIAREFEQGADTLAANLHRWDTGYWSRYDLFPHPVMNVASSFYHALHTSQLESMQVIAPRPEFEAAAARFAALRGSPCQHRAAHSRARCCSGSRSRATS